MRSSFVACLPCLGARFFSVDCCQPKRIRSLCTGVMGGGRRVVGAVKYLLWANLILNVVNIAPTLVISIVLALG